MLVAWLLQLAPPLIQTYYNPTSPIMAALPHLLSTLIGLLLSLALIRIGLKLTDNQPVGFSDFGSGLSLIVNYVVASFLYLLIICAGLILFIVPGIIWAVHYGLFPYFIVDKGAGPIEALKLSAKTTHGAKWDLFALSFVMGVINLLGVLCLFVGMLIAFPTTVIAQAFAYRLLVKQTNANQPT